ncbi:MAG: tRNA (guanosine(46)-N7)-methyltransferase TrmB [Gammaproteobacteria bacterium]|nr:tRNA (guanosine(46)-N7)-methyltransferase TrmB [Gammaproteobacteria bacterium]
MDKVLYRTIKSFTLRAGRLSPRQARALEEWLPNYVLPMQTSPWCLTDAFGRTADTIVEIGFGMGQSLVQMAQERPDVNFLGIEVHRAGIGSLVADVHDMGLTNVRVAPYDAVQVFQQCIAPCTLAGIQVFFPDPWPKARHHKRRLIQADFVSVLVEAIKMQGFLHCATDWEDYANHMLMVLNQEDLLCNQAIDGAFSPKPDTRPLTKFEARGQRLGHGTWDLMFKRVK